MQRWVDLIHTPLSADVATHFLADPRAGAIDLFLGTIRADDPGLIALDYTAYEPMALAEMRAIAERATERFGVVKLVMLHRLGRVDLSQASVLIGVCTPHRSAAFDACRWLIDTLKRDVPIWKRDVFADHIGPWTHPEPRSSCPTPD